MKQKKIQILESGRDSVSLVKSVIGTGDMVSRNLFSMDGFNGLHSPNHHQGGDMAVNRIKKKPANIDTLLREVLKTYDIPGRREYDKLYEKLDKIEKMLLAISPGGANIKKAPGDRMVDSAQLTASGAVFDVIKNSRQGADFSRIKLKTGFEEKKLRNIIFRLNKIGKIKRKARGLYVAI